MRFDIVHTLEIPQGATELTTSQLEQISGGRGHEYNNCKYGKYNRHKKHVKCGNKAKYGKCSKYGYDGYGDDCDD